MNGIKFCQEHNLKTITKPLATKPGLELFKTTTNAHPQATIESDNTSTVIKINKN